LEYTRDLEGNYWGFSTANKPGVEGLPQGTQFKEVDTGEDYVIIGKFWERVSQPTRVAPSTEAESGVVDVFNTLERVGWARAREVFVLADKDNEDTVYVGPGGAHIGLEPGQSMTFPFANLDMVNMRTVGAQVTTGFFDFSEYTYLTDIFEPFLLTEEGEDTNSLAPFEKTGDVITSIPQDPQTQPAALVFPDVPQSNKVILKARCKVPDDPSTSGGINNVGVFISDIFDPANPDPDAMWAGMGIISRRSDDPETGEERYRIEVTDAGAGSETYSLPSGTLESNDEYIATVIGEAGPDTLKVTFKVEVHGEVYEVSEEFDMSGAIGNINESVYHGIFPASENEGHWDYVAVATDGDEPVIADYTSNNQLAWITRN